MFHRESVSDGCRVRLACAVELLPAGALLRRLRIALDVIIACVHMFAFGDIGGGDTSIC